jgi:hypothetical protein
MSHDVILLSRVALPPRAGGYHGSWGPSPLWYAAVSIRVAAFHPTQHDALVRQLPSATGPFVEVIHVSHGAPAAEHAQGYLRVLQSATGAARFVEGRYDRQALPVPEPRTVAELERAFFRSDLDELSFLERAPEPWDAMLSDDEFLTTFGRARPACPPLQDVLLVREAALSQVEALSSGTATQVLPLFEWIREEPTRLSLVAARCSGEALRQLSHVVLPVGGASLDEKLFFALLPHTIPMES